MSGVRCSGTTSSPVLPISSAVAILVAAVLLELSLGGVTTAEEQTSSVAFSWSSTYEEAREAAVKHQRLLVVYFRPPVGAEPLPIRRAAAVKGLGRLVAAVRVGSREVLELKERFSVSRFPALIVLDPREIVLLHWQETIPADVWKRVARAFQQLEEGYARQEKDVVSAREHLDSGHADLAYRRLGPLLRSSRTAPRILRVAKELERRIIETGEERLLGVLAAEGLVPDDQLRQRLGALFAETLPADLAKARDRELSRLETTTIGGRE